MNFFGIGLPEMILIFVVALLIFGPKKLPEIGRSLGKAMRSFQDASKEFESEFKREAEQLEKSMSTGMEAKIEPPEPKALAASKSETENGVVDSSLKAHSERDADQSLDSDSIGEDAEARVDSHESSVEEEATDEKIASEAPKQEAVS
jgi:sec-independent protein translocase protein TatA